MCTLICASTGTCMLLFAHGGQRTISCIGSFTPHEIGSLVCYSIHQASSLGSFGILLSLHRLLGLQTHATLSSFTQGIQTQVLHAGAVSPWLLSHVAVFPWSQASDFVDGHSFRMKITFLQHLEDAAVLSFCYTWGHR